MGLPPGLRAPPGLRCGGSPGFGTRRARGAPRPGGRPTFAGRRLARPARLGKPPRVDLARLETLAARLGALAESGEPARLAGLRPLRTHGGMGLVTDVEGYVASLVRAVRRLREAEPEERVGEAWGWRCVRWRDELEAAARWAGVDRAG